MSGPTPINPQNTIGQGNEIAQSQQGYNTQTAQLQQLENQAAQAGSLPNQSSYLGTNTYVPTQVATGPNGVPIYSYTQQTQLSPIEQQIFGLQTGAQTKGGQAANQLLSGANYGSVSPSQAVGGIASGYTGQNLATQVSALEPYFNLQTKQAQDQLAAQGITPSTNPAAYNAGMLPVTTGQQSTVANYLASQAIPEQQMQESLYMDPAKLATQLTPQAQSPTSIPNATPALGQTTVQPVNVAAGVGAISNVDVAQAQQQQAQYNAMLQGLFGIPSSILGGLGQGAGKSLFA